MIRLLTDMDRWLLSSVYQPVANVARSRLGVNAHWLSAGTAALMGAMAALSMAGAMLSLLISKGNPVLVVVVVVDLWWLKVCRTQLVAQVRLARNLDKEDVMGRHALRSAEVLRGEPERTYWIAILSLFAVLDTLGGTGMSIVELGFLCWMSSLYFAACMTPPRRTRRAGAGFLSRFAAPGRA